MTNEPATAAASLGIVLHDHVIVSPGAAKSFKSEGLFAPVDRQA